MYNDQAQDCGDETDTYTKSPPLTYPVDFLLPIPWLTWGSYQFLSNIRIEI